MVRLDGRLAGLAPGSRVAGYLIEDLVGTGGMAAVFRARDTGLGRTVALKVLATGETIAERFAGEALAAAAVDHPHIIPVYAAGEADGYQYIAMRFVAGDDLNALIRREQAVSPRYALPPKRAAGYISPVASALDSAHEAGLVHRDIKPANILVDARPGTPEHVYLSDFGVARRMRSAGRLTVPGTFLGTPDYAAPEQANGRPVDGRADQYALACVAYELLTGSVPFKRDEPMLVLWAHVSAEPPRPTAARPDLPAAVDEVLARGLDKRPERRYDSCGAFAEALREALGLEPYGPVRPYGPASVAAPATEPATVLDHAAATRTLTAAEPPPVPRRPEPLPAPPSTAPVPPTQPLPGSSLPGQPPAVASTGTWTALVTADRAYYDNVHTVNAADAASLMFPALVPERRVPLAGTEIRIGRRSRSLRVEPEIDLTGPPTDPGVSRLHAALTRGADGTWSVVDLGSPNGIRVNGRDFPAGVGIPLTAGDRINLGAWTLITITHEP